MSETEWMGVDLTKIPRGELEFYPFPGQYFGEVMKENGLEVMFGVTAGDIAIIYDYLSEVGIKQVIFHDERAAGMAKRPRPSISRVALCGMTAWWRMSPQRLE